MGGWRRPRGFGRAYRHDGQPLTADDFVFAFQVYTADLPGFSCPSRKMSSIA